MENYTVKCDNCDFKGIEDDLVRVVEFKSNKDSEVEYLTTRDFEYKYGSLEDVFEYELIDGCPNCLTDGCLMDIKEDNEDEEFEIVLDYKDTEVYYLYKDFESKDSVWEYHYTLDPSDTEGFDVRNLSTYNEKISIEDNLKLAIDNNLI